MASRARLEQYAIAFARNDIDVVGDAGEQPAQLDRGCELAALVKGGADGCGFGLGDDEHAEEHEPCRLSEEILPGEEFDIE